MARTLAQWLAWQETLHPAEMDLGLERVRAVLGRLGLERPPFPVVTIAGTIDDSLLSVVRATDLQGAMRERLKTRVERVERND